MSLLSGGLIGDRSCFNCSQRLADHCTVHLIPCCPGRCPDERAARRAPPRRCPVTRAGGCRWCAATSPPATLSLREHTGAALNWLAAAGLCVTVTPGDTYSVVAITPVRMAGPSAGDYPRQFTAETMLAALTQAVAWSEQEGITP